ncbi:MAG: JAB domain-containing protein [Sphingomicrobium sp.]
MRYQRAELPLTIDGLDAAREFFAGCIADSNLRQEHLFVAHLDGESRCLHLSRHSGDETGANFPIREIVADAAAHGSAGIVLAHNHPSGDSRPSDADKRATRRLAAATEALDCAVLDHLVFGGRDVSSLRQLGYL